MPALTCRVRKSVFIEFALSFEITDLDKLRENCEILAKQFSYIFVNKILFYNVLRMNYELPKFILQEELSSSLFHSFIKFYFNEI